MTYGSDIVTCGRVKLEWDDRKRLANLAKHGLDLLRAGDVFAGPVVTVEDTRGIYGERRMVAIGLSRGRVLTCVYTDRTTADGRLVRRIISLRPASRKERQSYGDRACPPP